MPQNQPSEEQPQTAAHHVIPGHDNTVPGQTTAEALTPLPTDDEPVELITALGVFDPNLVFAAAVDLDLQDQWVCTLLHNERAQDSG